MEMEMDGDTIEVIEEDDDDADGTEIYAEEVGIEFNEESTDGFTATRPNSSGPVTIYRLIKLEHAEALGISLQEGSVTTPNQKTKIITRNIIKLNKPPRNMVLAQKNNRPTGSNRPDLMIEDQLTTNHRRRFICKLCNKGFRHASHLKRHINSHTGERLYNCEVCTKRFLDVSTLCRHRRTHTGDRPYVCKICDKCFGTLGSLRRHVTVHNQDSRPFSCTVCHKRFPDNSSFQKHRLIHTGLKPFECDICDKSFVHIGDLNGHKKIHEETKPWKCTRCYKEFSKQSNCARHSLIHEGDKEFVCHLCGVGYNFQSSLTRHLLTHRSKEKTMRKSSRKVVILTEIEGKGQSPDLEPSKLTLRQIKCLVRENKINFRNDSDEEEEDGPESPSIQVVVQEYGSSDILEGDKVEEVDYGDDSKESETLPQESTNESLKDETLNVKETLIINHVTNEGDVNYVIEQAEED